MPRVQETESTPDEQLFRRYLRADIVIPLLLICITVIVSLVSMVRAPQYSRYDEYTHADYAYRMWVGEVPRAGDVVHPDTLKDWACRGDMKLDPPPCGSLEATDPEAFSYQGIQYNYFHPPLFYTVTGFIAGPVSQLLGISFFTAARLVGMGFTALGIAAVYFAIRSWRVRPAASAAGSMLLLSAAVVMHNGFTVNPDSIAILIGAGVAWALGQYLNRGRVPVVALTGLMFAAAASKVIIAVPILVVCLFLFVDGIRSMIQGDSRRGAKLLTAAVLPVAVLVAIYVGWGWIQAQRGDPDFESPMSGLSTVEIVGNPLGEWFGTIPLRMFGIGGDYWTHADIDGWGTKLAAEAFGVVGTVAPFLALLIFPRMSSRWLAAIALIVGFMAVPAAVQLQAFVDAHEFFKQMNTRYGLGLLPLQMVLVALIVERLNWQRIALWCSAGLAMLYGASVFGLLKMS